MHERSSSVLRWRWAPFPSSEHPNGLLQNSLQKVHSRMKCKWSLALMACLSLRLINANVFLSSLSLRLSNMPKRPFKGSHLLRVPDFVHVLARSISCHWECYYLWTEANDCNWKGALYWLTALIQAFFRKGKRHFSRCHYTVRPYPWKAKEERVATIEQKTQSEAKQWQCRATTTLSNDARREERKKRRRTLVPSGKGRGREREGKERWWWWWVKE